MNHTGLNATEKNLAVIIGTTLYRFLEAEGFSESALEKFKATSLGRDSAVVDIQAYDDIHLVFLKFGADLPTHIVAVGDFSCDPYTLFNHFQEVSIAEYVSIWEMDSLWGMDSHRNPLLNFCKRSNDYPTIEIADLVKVYRDGQFTVTLNSENNDSKEYLIKGVEGTNSEGISILTEIAQNEFDVLSLSSVISHFTTDEFFMTDNGEILDDDVLHNETWKLVERLICKEA